MACSVCRGFGCNKSHHIQKCVICGQDERVVQERVKVDKGYKCADTKRHEVIWGGVRQRASDPRVETRPRMRRAA